MKSHLRPIVLAFCLCSLLSSCGYLKYRRNYTFPDKPRYANFNIVQSKSGPTDTIKVVTYNIKNSEKISKAVEILKTNGLADADILCLQEMDQLGVEMIAQELKLNYVYYPSSNYKERDAGNAVLTRFPILYDEKIILPHFNINGAQRIAVAATLEINAKKVKVYSVHLGVIIKPNQRSDQVEAIIRSMPPSIEHYITAGDFNTLTKVYRKAMLVPFLENNFQLGTERLGSTYSHWYLFHKKTALDHILTKGMTIVDAGKVVDKKASDHIPIWVTLRLSDTVE